VLDVQRRDATWLFYFHSADATRRVGQRRPSRINQKESPRARFAKTSPYAIDDDEASLSLSLSLFFSLFSRPRRSENELAARLSRSFPRSPRLFPFSFSLSLLPAVSLSLARARGAEAERNLQHCDSRPRNKDSPGEDSGRQRRSRTFTVGGSHAISCLSSVAALARRRQRRGSKSEREREREREKGREGTPAGRARATDR